MGEYRRGDFRAGRARWRGGMRGGSGHSSRFSEGPPEDDYMRNLESMKNAQTSKVDRKLYVGNLPAGITQTHLVDLMNTALINKNLNAYPGSPVLSAWISQDGHYAFVEFRSIEEANNAFALNNYPILGQNLKVGRPKTYAGAQPASVAARNTIMGGYTTTSITAYANLTDLTKQGPLKPLRVHLSTKVLCFHQIFKEAQLADDLEFEQVFEEFRTEVERRGKVMMVYVPRTGPQAGNVYMEFFSVEAAKAIRKVMFGRVFNGSPLHITYIPSQKFHQRDFSETAELELKING